MDRLHRATRSRSPHSSPDRHAHIDALRALAVSVVVFSHAGLSSVVPGSTGVTIFFTISGFIITLVMIRERDSTGRFDISAFYLRRAFKIAPPFVLIVVIPTLIFSQFGKIIWAHFIAQVLFVFNWLYVRNIGTVLPGSRIVWSLAIEEQFYIIFALIWLLLVQRRIDIRIGAMLSLLTILVPLLLRLVYHLHGALPIRILYGSDTRADSITIGVSAAFLFTFIEKREAAGSNRRTIFASGWPVLAAIVLFTASIAIRSSLYKDTLRLTSESVATAILILFGFFGSGRLVGMFHRVSRWRLIQWVGLSSYSIYLIHLELFAAAGHFLSPLPAGIRITILIILGEAAGVACWWLIERPALAWRHRLMDTRKQQTARTDSSTLSLN
jgi:peptidoglycan/LPS O-acetylase OafA/YrhL